MKITTLLKQLYFQIIVSILLGTMLGHLAPNIAIHMKPLGDAFIKLIRAVIPLILFATIVVGIFHLKSAKQARSIGIKAFIYFELVTTFAMIIGLVVANYFQPGAGLNIDIHSLDTSSLAPYTTQASSFNSIHFLLNIIPTSFISAFTQGETLQVLFVSILIGFGLLHAGDRVKFLIDGIEQFSQSLFVIIEWIMKLAPLAAFGAMSYVVGAHGVASLWVLGKLLVCFYLTCFLFICLVLGSIAKFANVNLWKFLLFIKEELLVVVGTATTETVLPQMIKKLEKLGCRKSIAGFVLPAGYAFNLDGMCIYLTIAIVFITQAFHLHLGLQDQIVIILILMLISKGAANVTGGGFIALATAISAMPSIPIEGLVLLLGIDRLMSEARSLTNLIGNGVATLVISKWEGAYEHNPDKIKPGGVSENSHS